jgi:serine-type D-Ala-D-Ala carboxypeptidase/endopeptidase (penicillin-binding protein 4)
MFRVLIAALALVSGLGAQAAAVRDVDSEKGIQVSCRVENLDGDVIFDWDGDTSRVLASNVKLLTTSCVLMALPSDYRWTTKAVLDGKSLTIVGGGDPSIRLLGDEDIPAQFLDSLASALKQKGVSQLDQVVLDDRFFDRVYRPDLWPKEQWQAAYSAPVGGLMVEGGCVELHGQNGQVQVVPSIGNAVQLKRLNVQKTSTFTASWSKTDEVLVVRGGPKKLWKLRFAVGNPVRFFGYWLQDGLRQRGISCNSVEIIKADDPPALGETIWQHQSAWTLQDAVIVANKQSDNFVSECLLKTLGAEKYGQGSVESGAKAVREILKDLDVDVDGLRQTDGSGFARAKDNSANKASPALVCALLRQMAQQSQGRQLFDSLPIAELDRRLKKFFGADVFKPQRVHAKTGWITGASSLSGYLQTPNEQTMVFSIVVNYVKDGTARTNNFRFRTLQAQILADILSSSAATKK